MKKGVVVSLLGMCLLLVCLAFGSKHEKAPEKPNGFALIELFSSEGCSSCPPAEAVMNMFRHRADAEILPVYIIEFHVDYWDYLGWKDTFANSDYTKRQQKYGDFFQLKSIYTPEAVINGKTEMVGSSEDQINTNVLAELTNPASVTIDCKATKTDNSKIEVDYTVTGVISGCNINVAVIESNLTTSIKKGENAGKTLTHDDVARVFKSIKLHDAAGKLIMDVPHVNLANAKVVCFVQNNKSMVITGATQVSILQ